MNLVEQLIRGNEPAFKQIFKDNYAGLLMFANSYVHNSFLAENIVQDAFVILWERRKDLNLESNLKAFLVTVIKNKAINILEKERNRARIDSNLLKVRETNHEIDALYSLNPEELFSAEIMDILNKALDSLPEQTRKIFMFSRYKGMSNKTIAANLGITEKGVEYHLSMC
jgi:RNA polymerase sigma-70 factor (ECF subfamily)